MASRLNVGSFPLRGRSKECTAERQNVSLEAPGTSLAVRSPIGRRSIIWEEPPLDLAPFHREA